MAEQRSPNEADRPGNRAVILALLASLALHAGVLWALGVSALLSRTSVRQAVRIEARIAHLPASQRSDVAGELVKNTIERPHPEPSRRSAAVTSPERSVAAERIKREARKPAQADVLKGRALAQANRRLSKVLFYPEEAVRLGLEGEAVVYVDLDGSGGIVAVEIAKSSGHAILDEAALRAVRAIGKFGGAAGPAVLMPVRFKLVSD